MVDVSSKPDVFREATAKGTIRLKPETIRLINEGKIAKGDPLYTAKIAGILAAKKTSELVPLCHPLPLTSVDLEAKILGESSVEVSGSSRPERRRMEWKRTAVSVALLTVWDMTKQYEKDASGQYPATVIENIHVVKKLKRA
jgi:cyclic pyranopterin phosphate synthase